MNESLGNKRSASSFVQREKKEGGKASADGSWINQCKMCGNHPGSSQIQRNLEGHGSPAENVGLSTGKNGKESMSGSFKGGNWGKQDKDFGDFKRKTEKEKSSKGNARVFDGMSGNPKFPVNVRKLQLSPYEPISERPSAPIEQRGSAPLDYHHQENIEVYPFRPVAPFESQWKNMIQRGSRKSSSEKISSSGLNNYPVQRRNEGINLREWEPIERPGFFRGNHHATFGDENPFSPESGRVSPKNSFAPQTAIPSNE